jgi:hypothetical protein
MTPRNGTHQDLVDDETLGPCGCTDYHMADCHLGNAGAGADYMTYEDWYESYDGPDEEEV